MRNRGFTLLEIVCVLLLMGLLAGAAAMSFATPLRGARQRQGVEQVCAFDASARLAARRAGRPVEIEIDTYEQRLARREDGRPVANAAALPGGLRIEQVRVSGEQGEKGSESSVSIQVSSHGISRSYALRVTGEGFDRWLLFAGLSGQVTVLNDESQVDQVLHASAEARRDAD